MTSLPSLVSYLNELPVCYLNAMARWSKYLFLIVNFDICRCHWLCPSDRVPPGKGRPHSCCGMLPVQKSSS